MALIKFYDNYGCYINYVCLAVMDCCNFCCFYCMLEEGIKYVFKEVFLFYEEMLCFMYLFVGMGIEKVWIIGGEFFVCCDMIYFLWQFCVIEGIKKVNIIINGMFIEDLVLEFKFIGINFVNFSFDVLDKDCFFEIIWCDVYDKVMVIYWVLLEYNIFIKINVVVMDGKNIEDIILMAMFI